MKRFVTVLLAIGILLLLGCQKGNTEDHTDGEETPSEETPNDDKEIVAIGPDPIWGIELRSIEKLDEARQKLSCSDEEFNEYFWFYANNGKLPVDRGDAVMIQLVTSKGRNLSRLWDSSVSGEKY